jgi:tRNA(fMet)-specific endonuclease VapC
LSSVRRAEAGKGRTSLPIAFREFQRSLTELAAYPLLPYTAAAETQVQQWRAAKVRIGSQDLRIAAICIAHGAKLVTRNARDYTQVPGLNLEIWN